MNKRQEIKGVRSIILSKEVVPWTMENIPKGKFTQAIINQGKITQYDYPWYYSPVSN